ncbi:SDR family oxidoreductase [Fulvimarina endophytica]|uniref:SDR family oxidoreductase n=1 Tax=Fulvimarina endophytica TaxID=2293836 RepID=A0A371WYC9_9HYPH|nr:SDR family NAD(P)-dependent oxidoreductase [Fulvimarina endophytica]RFC61997.1 SDR family oxidoreductase [Fulvimarina endophytica]
MELKGRTALVTGAGGSIGSAIACALASEGATIIALDRDEDVLSAIAGRLDGICHPVGVDLRDQEKLEAVAQDLVSEHGRIDILVNNAGILSGDKLAAVTLPDWHELMRINVDAAMILTRALVPGMRENGWGRLVNMTSFAWKSGGLTAGTAYAVSKAALVGLTYSAARELAPYGVTANAVAPAYVLTPMITEQLSEEDRNRQLSAIPVGRFCDPDEVAHAVRYLASPLSGFVTGMVIDMNGGLQFG